MTLSRIKGTSNQRALTTVISNLCGGSNGLGRSSRNQGAQGSAGATGPTGPAGVQGPPRAQGPQGLDASGITKEDIRARLYDNATFEVRTVNWADLTQLDLRLLSGTIGDVGPFGNGLTGPEGPAGAEGPPGPSGQQQLLPTTTSFAGRRRSRPS